MPQWNNIQSHVHDLMEQGKKLVRVGVADAEYLLNVTVNATRLHVAIRRDQIAKHRILHELGRELWKALPADGETASIRVTSSMREKVRRIEALESEIRLAEQEAALISVVRRDDEQPTTPDKAPPRERRTPKE